MSKEALKIEITPNTNKALLRLEPLKTVSDGGIILNQPDFVETMDRKWRIGEVLAIGPPPFNRKGVRVLPEFKVGDRVVITDYHTTEIGVKDVFFVGYEDVIAVLEIAA